MDTGTSLLASRYKRNLLALMLEELPTLSKMQLHKPHVYDKDWICCHCELDSEDFNHLWLCSKSSIDLQNIIPQAKILLQDTINLFTTSGTSTLGIAFCFLISVSPTRKLDRLTSEPLLPTSMSLVDDFMNYGKVYPFPSGNNLVTWVLSIFW